MAKLYKWIIYSGIAAFICLLLGFLAAMTDIYRVHKVLGILTFIFACLHIGLIVYKNLKLKAAKNP